MANLSRIKSARWAFNCRDWKPTESDWLTVSSSLRKDEKENVGRFVYQRDSKFAMAGRLISRKFIVDATGMEWKDVNIVRDHNNKPHISSDSCTGTDIQFNISHAGDYVVFGAEIGDLKLGVDVMSLIDDRRKNIPEFFRLMSRLFADEEWKTIKSRKTETEQMNMFYRYWCLKESFTKALGTGITLNLKTIMFKLNSQELNNERFVEDTEVFVNGVKQANWLFQEMLLNDTHSVAVAIHNLTPNTCCNKFSLVQYDDLIKNIMQVTPPDVQYCKQFMSKES